MLMVVWAPLAGGAERPAATALVEQMVFTLVVIWVLKSTLLQPPAAPASAQLMRLAIPMAAFAAYIALQLVPLSPAIMKVVSASTHHLYVRTRMAPPWLNANPAPPLETLSIAPALTRSALLKVLAYFCLMLVVAHYPLEPRNSGREAQSFTGALGVAALISALMAGLAGAVFLFGGHRGLAEVPTLTTLRASGTFHNADHFADYLMLAFPLAVTGALSPESFVRRGWREPFTLFATLTSVVCLVGLMISLSRGAWLAGVLGSAALVFAGSRRQPRNIDGPEPRRGRIIPYAALAGCLLLLLALIVAGAPATGAIADRLSETAGYDTSMLDRFTVWRDSLAVVRDFPALGVGLGCWPEIFSRYDRAPWDPDYFWREAHNDYLQLLEEAGAIGALLAGWILFAQGRALLLARQAVSSRRLALVAAAIAGAVGVAAHELFDFSLQVPANALLLVVILGLAHRQAAHAGVQWWQPARTSSGRIYAAMGSAAVAIVALLLITCTWRHDRLAYPDNLDSGMDAAAALGPAAATARITAMIRAYPAHGPLHLELGRVLQARGLDGPAQHELDTAVWL
ncbi:MAG TPA: O-antigen ligase family protein [Candidatus Binataceae bacterium]